MRLSKERIRHISESIATKLQQEGQVAIVGDHKAFVELIDHAIVEELSVEDRLNAEVRQLRVGRVRKLRLGPSLAAALPGARRVSARQGLGG